MRMWNGGDPARCHYVVCGLGEGLLVAEMEEAIIGKLSAWKRSSPFVKLFVGDGRLSNDVIGADKNSINLFIC